MSTSKEIFKRDFVGPSKPRKTPKLFKPEPFKYDSKKHGDDFARLVLYFNKLYQWSMPQKAQNGVHRFQTIPLSKLNRSLSRKRNQPLVKFAASIWFNQLTRGDSVNKKCSVWSRRDHPLINAQAIRAIKELGLENVEVIDEMWTHASQKNDLDVEVTIKTVIRFPTVELAKQFHSQFDELFARGEQ